MPIAKLRTARRSLLAGLALAAAACATVSHSDPVDIPFDPRAHEIGIPAVVEGRNLTFLIDTAVEPSALDRGVAGELGLRQSGPGAEIEGAGQDRATAYPSVIPKLSIDGKGFGPIEVLVADLSKLAARYGAPLHGILGYSLLKDHAVLLDYPASRVTIFDGPAAAEPAECATVHRFPLRFLSQDDKLILVPGLTIGGAELPAFIDTGSSSGLRIDLDAPAVAPIKASLPEGTESSSVGARGLARQRRAALPNPVRLGPLTLDEAEVSLVSGAPMAVGIGNRFFEALGARLLVDMPAGRVGIYTGCS